MKLVSLVVPVYNEEEMLPIFFKKIEELFHDDDNYHYEFLLINDGSKDKTLDIIKEEAQKNDRLSYISFSRNYSQECAVEAGLRSAKGDVVIPLDCDFQDPPEVVFDMLKKYEEGYEVVNGKRSNRDDDTAMKKTTAGLFYKLTNKVAGKKVIEENVCFYRLMSRRVVDYINSLPEASRILRSQVPYIGFKTCDVFFARKKEKQVKLSIIIQN
ncbi:MAG: glycosyltransferase family 2 protein [Bacilli bacterium]